MNNGTQNENGWGVSSPDQVENSGAVDWEPIRRFVYRYVPEMVWYIKEQGLEVKM